MTRAVQHGYSYRTAHRVDASDSSAGPMSGSVRSLPATSAFVVAQMYVRFTEQAETVEPSEDEEDDRSRDSGSISDEYIICSAARASGVPPLYVGEPGYST